MKRTISIAISIALLSIFLLSSSAVGQSSPQTLSYIESSIGLNLKFESGRSEIEMGDVNNDGNLDLVSIGDHGNPRINSKEQGLMVWLGDGLGNWTLSQTGNFGYGGVALGDVNNDGKIDVGYGMHHNYGSSDFGDQLLEVALGDNTGKNWTPWDDGLATNGENYGMFGTDFADVNNDGLLDVGSISFGCCSGVHVYLNQGNGSWVQSFGIVNGNSSQEFEFGDVNGDGYADFAASYSSSLVYIGDGTGNFTSGNGNLPTNTYGNPSPSLADTNHDGRDEIAFINKRNGIDVWAWISANTWQEISGSLPDQATYSAVQLFDMNMDGHLDVVAYGNRWMRIWAGDGSGGWTRYPHSRYPDSPGTYSAFRVGGDADHNGYPDIVILASQGSGFNPVNKLRFYKETSAPTTQTIKPIFPLGHETLRAGGIVFMDWISAIPANLPGTVKLEISIRGTKGPWRVIANGIPNSGRYQWQIPANTPLTNTAYIRYTLTTSSLVVSTITPAAFNILPK